MPEMWAHQKRAREFALGALDELGGGMLAMDMGTGKTRVALSCASSVKPSRTLVICPKSVIPVWEEQLGLYWEAGSAPATFARNSKNRAAQDAEALSKQLDGGDPVFVIMNYDVFSRDSELRDLLLEESWDIVIADESHRLKNPDAKVTQHVIQLDRWGALALTGTPYVNSHLDAWGQIMFCAPEVFQNQNFTAFRDRYVSVLPDGVRHHKRFIIAQKANGNKVWAVPKNMDDFNQRMRGCSFSVSMKDADLDMPNVVDLKYYAEMPAKCMKAYEDMRHRLVAKLDKGKATASNEDVVVMRLQQILSGMVPVTDKSGKPKMEHVGGKSEALKEVLEDIPVDEPVVVFGRFRSDLDTIAEVAGKADTAELSGRKNELKRWQDGKCRVLAVQTESGSEGVDLTRASHAIWYTMSWSASSYKQARARLVRPGQTSSTVRFIHILAKKTIDESLYNRVVAKGKTASSLLAEISTRR